MSSGIGKYNIVGNVARTGKIRKRKSYTGFVFKLISTIVMITFFAISVLYLYIANDILTGMANVRVVKNESTLSDYGLVGQEIMVTNKDNLKINAYLVPNEGSKAVVLLLHGMHGMDASSLFNYAKFIYDEGYTPVCVDMRAHGKSEGESLTFGYREIYDIEAIVAYLKQEEAFKDQKIIVYGLSMGGTAAINAAAHTPDIDAVIAVSPFSDIRRQIWDYMDEYPGVIRVSMKPYFDIILALNYKINPYKSSPEVSIQAITERPVLIVHGTKDSQTKVYQAELLKEKAGENCELWLVDGADHLIIDNLKSDEAVLYKQRIADFIRYSIR